jgi:hypothetical protein
LPGRDRRAIEGDGIQSEKEFERLADRLIEVLNASRSRVIEREGIEGIQLEKQVEKLADRLIEVMDRKAEPAKKRHQGEPSSTPAPTPDVATPLG